MVCLFVQPDAGFAANKEGIRFLEQMNQALSDSIKTALPTVVNIRSAKTQEVSNPMEGSPFEDFFFFHRPKNQDPRAFRSFSLGSGVIVDGEKGYILTNNHVVEGAEEIFVDYFDPDGGTISFEGEAFNDPKTELAMVKIKDLKGVTLPEAILGDSDTLEVGYIVLAIGSPFQKSQSVSKGIVSALGRQETGPQFERVLYKDFIQTDAAINQGNSGGPLLNIYGEVVGINTYIYSTSGGAQGVGFAIPIKWAKPVIAQLITTGKVVRPFLGIEMVSVKDISSERKEQMGIGNQDRGVLIQRLHSNTPADEAGLQVADVLLEFDSKPIESSRGLQLQVLDKKIGDKVEIKLWRPSEEKVITLSVVLGEQPENLNQMAMAPSSAVNDRLGMSLSPMTQQQADQLNIKEKKGLFIEKVQPGGVADQQGIRPEDVLLRADFKPVNSIDEFDQILKDLKEQEKTTALLEILRGSLRFMAVLSIEEK